jgi:hypothetical protein
MPFVIACCKVAVCSSAASSAFEVKKIGKVAGLPMISAMITFFDSAGFFSPLDGLAGVDEANYKFLPFHDIAVVREYHLEMVGRY